MSRFERRDQEVFFLGIWKFFFIPSSKSLLNVLKVCKIYCLCSSAPVQLILQTFHWNHSSLIVFGGSITSFWNFWRNESHTASPTNGTESQRLHFYTNATASNLAPANCNALPLCGLCDPFTRVVVVSPGATAAVHLRPTIINILCRHSICLERDR